MDIGITGGEQCCQEPCYSRNWFELVTVLGAPYLHNSFYNWSKIYQARFKQLCPTYVSVIRVFRWAVFLALEIIPTMLTPMYSTEDYCIPNIRPQFRPETDQIWYGFCALCSTILFHSCSVPKHCSSEPTAHWSESLCSPTYFFPLLPQRNFTIMVKIKLS